MRRSFLFALVAGSVLVPAQKADADEKTQTTTALTSRFAITVDGQFAGWAQKAEGLDATWSLSDYRAGDAGNARWFFPANTKNRALKLTFVDGLVGLDWMLVKAAIAGSSTQHTMGIGLYDASSHLLTQWTLSNAFLSSFTLSPLDKARTQNATVSFVFYGETYTTTGSAPTTATWAAPTGDLEPSGFAFDFTNCGTACASASQLTFTASPQIRLPASDPVKSAAKGSAAVAGALAILSKSGGHLLDLHYQTVGIANGPQVIAATTNATTLVTFAPKITKVL